MASAGHAPGADTAYSPTTSPQANPPANRRRPPRTDLLLQVEVATLVWIPPATQRGGAYPAVTDPSETMPSARNAARWHPPGSLHLPALPGCAAVVLLSAGGSRGRPR